jgi:hypothetical protein
VYPRLLIAGLMLALWPLAAADFWDEKKFTDWTDKQVRRMLDDSPWARPIAISGGGGGMPGGGGGRGGRGRSGGGGGGMDAGDMDVGGGGGGMSAPQAPPSVMAIMRWHTALPVKEAVARMRYGAEAGTSAEAQKSLTRQEQQYVVGLANVPMGLLRNVKPDEVKNNVRLKLKKREIAPAHVQVERQGPAMNLYMIFPRGQDGSPAIELSDGEVEVEIKLGSTKLSRKFKLKDMVYQGKLEI